MNLLDLIKLPAADTVLPALPVLPGALPAAAPLLPAFADALAQLQPVAAATGLQATQPGEPAPSPSPMPEDASAQASSAAALPPEGLVWMAAAALTPPAAEPAQTEVETDHAEPSDAGLVAPPIPTLIAPVPLAGAMPAPAALAASTPAPTEALVVAAEPAALPAMLRPEAGDAPIAAPTAVPAWQPPPATGPIAPVPTPRAATAAPPSEQAVPAALREAAGRAEPALPAQLEGWLAAQAADAEPAPAAPLQTMLRLPEPQAAAEPGKAWRQPLLVALGDRLQLQIAARSEQAVIRLEPPLLGRIDIAIRHEGGELQVRLAASHAEVGRQLQQITEPLRQDLLQRHSGEVSVQVSTPADGARGGSEAQAGGRGATAQQQQQQQQQQQPHQERRPGRGLAEEGEAGGFATPR